MNYPQGAAPDQEDLSVAVPLYCYAVSAKRYVLFNKIDGHVVVRKASAHGLGHLLPPFDNPDSEQKSNDKVVFWHKELWSAICEAALRGEDHNGAFLDDERFLKPAASRYTANTPKLLSWFSGHNESLPWIECVRPGNFVLTFQCKNLVLLAATNHEAASWLQARYTSPKPTAPFSRDSERAAHQAFDRQTGMTVPIEFLKTYSDVLRNYHLHAEAKFHGGFGDNRGKLNRRHIHAVAVRHIGKEAHNWEEHALTGGEGDIAVRRGHGIINRSKTLQDIRGARTRFGVRALSRAAGIGDGLLKAACDGVPEVKAEKLVTLLRAAHLLALEETRLASDRERSLELLKQLVEEIGHVPVAKEIGTDPSNLRKITAGKRSISDKLHRRLMQSHFAERLSQPS